MNESDYMKALWKRIATGKVGNQGQGYLDTGWLDSAFGGADVRRGLMLQGIGDNMTNTTNSLNLSQKRVDNQASRYAQNYNMAKTNIDNASRDALVGDVITGATIPISFIEGRNQASAIDEEKARQDRLNRRYEQLLGTMR